jgi:hypothetical protein
LPKVYLGYAGVSALSLVEFPKASTVRSGGKWWLLPPLAIRAVCVPCVGLILYPALKLLGGAAQDIAADRIKVSIGSEKAHDPLGLLKRLDKPVQQDPVKTPIAKADAVLLWCS